MKATGVSVCEWQPIVESWPRALEEAYWRDPKVRSSEVVGSWKPRAVEGEQQFREQGQDATVSHFRHWVESIRTRKPYWQDAAAGHRAASCAHMVNLSASQKRTVQWDFAADDIKGA